MSDIFNILKDNWGYDHFRFPQEEIIVNVINNKDTIALLATGAGKSICFQVPGLYLDGLCVVVSPLIALMDDQVSRLKEMGIRAEAIHSALLMKDVDRILNNAFYGKLKFLYLSPERLQSDIVMHRLVDLNISMVAIDEAHCISQWGYDFRPSYLEIGKIRTLLKQTPFIALTATASERVLNDISESLLLNAPTIFKTSFLRNNISLNCIQMVEKKKECIRIATRIKGSGIIYVRSRHQAENIAEALSKKNISAIFYHAGMSSKQRHTIQDKWKKGIYRIVVATNAFGMGIDKADVRFVMHYDVPDKPEEYYQEAGRAGRDGLPSTAIMLYNESDISKMDMFFQEQFPSIEEIKLLFHRICVGLQLAVGSGKEESFDFDIDYFCDKYGYKTNFVRQGIKTISQAGWIEYINGNQRSSELQIIIDNRSLRSILRDYPIVEKLVDAILRMYEAIFFDVVHINEVRLSKLSGLPESQVRKILRGMQTRKWVNYVEHLSDGKLFFHKDRPAAINFSIDRAHYNYLKKMSTERVRAIKKYISSEICRQKQLLTYFGEVLKKDCGICDICRGSNLTEFTSNEKEHNAKLIKELLEEKPMALKDLLYLWPYNKKNRLLNLIRIMENENYLVIRSGIVSLKV